jgi:hypothetical protein
MCLTQMLVCFALSLLCLWHADSIYMYAKVDVYEANCNVRKLPCMSSQAGRQAGRHDWFYYTSTKCAIPDNMAGQQRF